MHRRDRRTGLASLEFVMSFPILVVMGGLIFGFAQLALGRMQAAIETRANTWRDRESARGGETAPLPDPAGLQAVLADRAVADSLAERTASRTVKLSPVRAFARAVATPRSTTAVLGNPWDHPAIALRSNRLQPDLELATALAGQSLNMETNFRAILDQSGPMRMLNEIGQRVQALRGPLNDLKEGIDELVKAIEKFTNLNPLDKPEALVRLKRAIEKLARGAVGIAGQVGPLIGRVAQAASQLGVNLDGILGHFGQQLAQQTLGSPVNLLDLPGELKDLPDKLKGLGEAFSGFMPLFDRLVSDD